MGADVCHYLGGIPLTLVNLHTFYLLASPETIRSWGGEQQEGGWHRR